MIALPVSAAFVALAAMFAAWRAGRRVPLITGLGGLAAALAATAWWPGPVADAFANRAPRSWLVESAQAFNKPPVAAVQGQAGSLPELAARYVAEGQRYRIQRKFPEAAEAFRKAVEADPVDADSWADLADAAAVAAGRDLTVSRDAIRQALVINPRHRKALWLRASLELQEGRYAQAAQTWRTLSALVEPGSPDARVIAANISEADSLAARTRQEG